MKKNHVFKVGDRVGISNGLNMAEFDPESSPDYGEVTDVLSDGRVMIKWDSDWRNKSYKDPVDSSTLLPEKELQEIDAKLEKEFKVLEKEVVVKMKEAGKLIKEANKLAQKAGRSLHEMYEAVGPLESAMDAAGWRTSSWGC